MDSDEYNQYREQGYFVVSSQGILLLLAIAGCDTYLYDHGKEKDKNVLNLKMVCQQKNPSSIIEI